MSCDTNNNSVRKLLITDGLVIPKTGNYNFSIVLKKNCILEDVLNLLKKEKLKPSDIVLVSVGSFNVTAKECGWDEKLIIGKFDLLEDAVNQFKCCLCELRDYAKEQSIKIAFCGLIPIPMEQNHDNAPDNKKELVDLVSKLFVSCSLEISKKNNNTGGQKK